MNSYDEGINKHWNQIATSYTLNSAPDHSIAYRALQLTAYQLILIRRHRRKDGLREDVSTILLSLQVGDRAAMFPPLDEMYPRLVPVHGIENDLKRHKKYISRCKC